MKIHLKIGIRENYRSKSDYSVVKRWEITNYQADWVVCRAVIVLYTSTVIPAF